MSHPIDTIAARHYRLNLAEDEQVCHDCHGSGRHRIRFGQSYDERRDTITCPNCDGNGKHKIGQPHKGMFDFLDQPGGQSCST